MQTPSQNLWHEATEGLCPTCLRRVPATVFEEEGRIWIRQECAKHGENIALLASNAEEYKRFRQHVPPRMEGGCCGGEAVCEGGKPPVCVLLLEITLACNLRCPTCYADAHGHDFMGLEEVARRLDTFFRQQSQLDILMLSGGEPTIHPRFSEILALVLRYPITRILINTNGLRLYQSRELVECIAAHRDRVELYFSFSSFRADVQERLYGRDLRTEKRGALERAQEAGIFVTLVPTVERGVNEQEIGELYRFALSMDNINGITYQPVMNNGRYAYEYPPEQRLTLTDVLQELERQTAGQLIPADFVGLPCSHPDCCVLTYGFLDANRTEIMPLPRYMDVGQYLDLFADKISFSGMLSTVTRRVWSDVTHLRARQTLRDLGLLFWKGGLKEVVPLMGNPAEFGRRVFRVVVKPFMDAHTYDFKRIDQCCTMILDAEGKAVSFCEYNVFHRGRKSKESVIPLTLRVGGTQ